MSYYETLGLNKEPFSTSPDPDFFYRSQAHNSALKRLEIGIRLKRGMSLVLGDVGTGKTTLLRSLLQEFAGEDDFQFHMILDPVYTSEFHFLKTLARMFNIEPDNNSTHDYKSELERYLFRKGVDEQKTLVLLVDEAQKLTSNLLEILRVLLNYETNDYKLLQLIIMGQMELLPKTQRIKNFYDRVVLKYILNPLDEHETAEMIKFRLHRAGLAGDRTLFTPDSVKTIYEYSQGYPRKVALLCHNAVEELIMRGKDMIDDEIVESVVRREMI